MCVRMHAGAKTPLAQFVPAWVVAFVLIWLTPLFAYLPYNVFGAVVMSAVLLHFEYELAIYLFRVRVGGQRFFVWTPGEALDTPT